jgi:hypothetical protein
MFVNVHELTFCSKLTFCGALWCVRMVMLQAGSPQWLALRPIHMAGVCVCVALPLVDAELGRMQRQ